MVVEPERAVEVDVEIGLRELLDDVERDRVRHGRTYHKPERGSSERMLRPLQLLASSRVSHASSLSMASEIVFAEPSWEVISTPTRT